MVLIAAIVLTFVSSASYAFKEQVRKRGMMAKLPTPKTNWDSNKTYRQLVVLVSFADRDFSMEDPQSVYHSIFNEPGYNQREGVGCVADYFRDQSAGLFNLQFDVYGPFKITRKAQVSTSSEIDDGQSVFRAATQKMIIAHPEIDYSLYDWNQDGHVDQIIYVYAGYSGNQVGLEGYIWPTTGTFSSIETPDHYIIDNYSGSGELWKNNTSCGIGTICHEFSHCLGLPDIYPTDPFASTLSVVDEWDLMDDGSVTNRGWCPPNYSPLEKMLLGWYTPVELTQDIQITDLKPLSEGGDAYLVRHTDSEYYLLENRQWKGWDFGLPGHGLIVYHVYYNSGRWRDNTVNNINGKPYYSIVTADNQDFTTWYNQIIAEGLNNPYVDSQRRLNSRILSTAPYPCESSTGFVNNALTNTSVPANRMYEADNDGAVYLSKSITDIVEHEDGTVSFTFHTTGNPDGIENIIVNSPTGKKGIFTLTGRKLKDNSTMEDLPKGIYIVDGKVMVRQ